MKYKLTVPTGSAAAAVVGTPYENLDPQQLEAVRAPLTPLLIVAGAGTGKTRTLMARCAHLILSGVAPERILLCTFTLKAAREMRSRIHALVGPIANQIWAGTFHHVGHRLLRLYGSHLGLIPDFSIIDSEDARDFLAMILGDLKVEPPITASKCQTLFSMAQGCQEPLSETARREVPEFVGRIEAVERVFSVYQERKAAQHVVDFDDMLVLWKRLLQEESDAAVLLRGLFDHVLVDEYQDTNPLQADIVELMVRDHRHVTVVGDDAQSIYSFRGARLDALNLFLERFPDADLAKLERNYRSTQPILDLANTSLAISTRIIKKTLVTQRTGGTLPILVRTADTAQEAQFVAQRLWDLHTESAIPLNEIAVLTRTNAQSLQIQLEFSRRGIPFRVQGGMRILEQAHFKDFIGFLRVLVNPADEMAVMRVFKLMPGLGAQTALQVSEVLRSPSNPWTLDDVHPMAQTLLWAKLTPARRKKVLELGQFFETVKTYRNNLPELLEGVLRKYTPVLRSKYEHAEDRLEELVSLVEVGAQYGTPDALLADLGLQSGPVAEVFKTMEEPEDLAVLSTVHQSKGLEWTAVFVPAMSEGSFPLLFTKNPDAIEEERRVFHVAVTRAKDELYLIQPLMSGASDRTRVFRRLSRFVAELPPRLYETWEIEVE
ncbi:MAG: ATP-dependent DNA helicase [Deltaproteobacteria bacterium HGW-Deltaproteobacteria-22]|jgi:DNA helicase-2/ATP-dependent DNA helicase PcrA|nr:MAG: ATP-dependent DNA helicase [Deltaproteobacteria bacterium HGW-Deltaproteobacteria-22]